MFNIDLPLVVSLGSSFIALSALTLAFAKFRLDLYNRRLAIYLAALDLYQACISDEAGTLKKSYLSLITASREAQFLFSERHGVTAFLERLRDEAWNIMILRDYAGKPEMDGASRILYERSFGSDVLDKMQSILSELEEVLRPYLTYRVWDWKFWRYWRKPVSKKSKRKR